MDNLFLIAGVLVAYLIGSVPTAVWVGKTFYGVDVRTKGSGNAGATNTIRVLGVKAGMPVLIFDVFKGWLAVYLGNVFLSPAFTADQMVIYKIVLGVAAVLGHVLPVFAGFRGGKGIATLSGVGIALFPVAIWVVSGVFIIVLLISRYVSLASMLAAVAFPFLVILLFNPHSVPLIILSIFTGIFVPFTHRKNIGRLIAGTESKFKLKKKTGTGK